MFKKTITFMIVFGIMLAVSPACFARNSSNNYDDSGYNRRNNNYRYDNGSDREYGRSGRRDGDYSNSYTYTYRGRKNAAAYPDYVSNTDYYYGTGSYNYDYNSGCVCNCPVNYGYGYSYYNPTPGATNYTRPVVSNRGCANRYDYNYTNYDYNDYRYRYSY